MSKIDFSRLVEVVQTSTGEPFHADPKHLLKIDKDSVEVSLCNKSENSGGKLPVDVIRVTRERNLENREQEEAEKKRIHWVHSYREPECDKMGRVPLTVTAYRVWFGLRALAKWGNYVDGGLREVSDRVGIAVPHVSSAIKLLEDNDILIKITRSKIRLNPADCWIGNTEAQQKAVAEYYRQKNIAAAKARASAKAKAKKEKAKQKAVSKRRAAIKLVK